MRRVILLICFLLSVSNAADGLSVYTDPDFPNFSFEYDPSVWKLEQHVFNPVTSRKLKVLTAQNQNGEKLIFSFEYPEETGFDGLFQAFQSEEIMFVGGVAVRIMDDSLYYPQLYFTSCISNFQECEAQARMMRFPQLNQNIVAVGDRVGVFYTSVRQSFVDNLEVDEIRNSRIWLTIEISPVGLESYQADNIISTMTY